MDQDCSMSEAEKYLNYKVNIILSVLSSILMMLLVNIGYKVYKIVKFNDKMILLMLLFLVLELACKFKRLKKPCI